MAGEQLGINKNTLTKWLNKFRIVMGDCIEENQIMLGGPGVVVELDESHFGRRMHHKGRMIKGLWVFGGVERTDKTKTFFQIVDKRDHEPLS